MQIQFDETGIGFPSLYLRPLKTALGNAWPRPRVRRIMEDLETTQKKMSELQMRLGGLQKTPKDQRGNRGIEWMQEYKLLEVELARHMEEFRKMPVTKEQFKRPDADLSECCDAYVKEEADIEAQAASLEQDLEIPVKHSCVECGNYCRIYQRLEREEWAKEYKEAMEDRKKEAEQQVKDQKQMEVMQKALPVPPKTAPMKSGYLLT